MVVKALLLLLVLVQFPFLYQMCASSRLNQYVERLPREDDLEVPFADLRGALHIHSAAGSHSLGTYPQLIGVAKQANYDYLFITDHPKEYTLFNEVEDPDLVVLYGIEDERESGGRNLRTKDSRVMIYSLYETGSVPEDVTGIEIYNLAENAKAKNNLFSWLTWLYHRLGYGDLFFFHLWEMNQQTLGFWDDQNQIRQLPAFAGNNAHQNLGVILVSGAGERIFSLFVDPYIESFEFVTNHLLVPVQAEISRETVIQALLQGSSYIAFEKIADPTGFTFHAAVDGVVRPMGSEVPAGSDLIFQAPVPSRFKLIRAGTPYRELEGTRFVLESKLTGTYRVEVYPLNAPSLIEGKPWIISNPIYVR